MYGPIQLTTLNGTQEEKNSKPTFVGSFLGAELQSSHWILYRFHAENANWVPLLEKLFTISVVIQEILIIIGSKGFISETVRYNYFQWRTILGCNEVVKLFSFSCLFNVYSQLRGEKHQREKKNLDDNQSYGNLGKFLDKVCYNINKRL